MLIEIEADFMILMMIARCVKEGTLSWRHTQVIKNILYNCFQNKT